MAAELATGKAGRGAASAATASTGTILFAAWQISIVCFLFGRAMVAEYGYDEDQYIAAGVFAGKLSIYSDFIYLQTPAYPLILSTIFTLIDGYYLQTGRLLTWCLSVGTCALLFRLLRYLGASRAMAILLPGRAGSKHPRTMLAASGFCVGLAAAVKISYCFAPLVIAIHAAMQERRGHATAKRQLAPVIAGAGMATLPGLYYCLVAPDGFLYGVLEYHLTAPIAWYLNEGKASLLQTSHKLQLLSHLSLLGGNGTLLMLAVAFAAVRRLQTHQAKRQASRDGSTHLLVALFVAAALFSYLPRPLWPMYFAPLAPLMACLVAVLYGRVQAAGSHRLVPVMVAAALLPSLVVLEPLLRPLGRLAELEHWPGVAANRQARHVQQAILRSGGAGHVATLFPSQVLDANTVRPEFASGPFFFRTAEPLGPERIARLHGASAQSLDRLFAADPPAAIFGGLHANIWQQPMDAALRDYAERHGYVRTQPRLPVGGATTGWLYLRPGRNPRTIPDAVQ